MILINGIVKDSLNIKDRSIHYGDGCFTTARIKNGRIVWHLLHLLRLRNTCRFLMIDDVDWNQLNQEIQAVASFYDNAVMKIIITRGNSSDLGYSSQGCTSTRIVMCMPYPEKYIHLRRLGAKVFIAQTNLSIYSNSTKFKYLNRLDQVLISIEINKRKADEALVVDTHGYLIECCSANVFWRKGEYLFTPDLSVCGIKGLARYHLIKLARKLGLSINFVREFPCTLDNADEILMCNSLMPLISIRQVESCKYYSQEFYNTVISQNNEWI